MLAFPKQGRIKLKGQAYTNLKQRVFALDRARCRVCGRTENLSLHHMVKRSTLRIDTVHNCLTLCILCNQAEKERKLFVKWVDVQTRTIAFSRPLGTVP